MWHGFAWIVRVVSRKSRADACQCIQPGKIVEIIEKGISPALRLITYAVGAIRRRQ
jgi:hypothetical protein